jgi:CheY-like chemotaxis protein
LNPTNLSETDKKTVMVCDDDQDLRQLFGQALGSKYNIILVGSGEDCIDKCLEEKNLGNTIHLILLDYSLGDISGDTVARRIKEFNGVEIILISAYVLDEELIKDLQENKYIATFVEKPIHMHNLIELVSNTIN